MQAWENLGQSTGLNIRSVVGSPLGDAVDIWQHFSLDIFERREGILVLFLCACVPVISGLLCFQVKIRNAKNDHMFVREHGRRSGSKRCTIIPPHMYTMPTNVHTTCTSAHRQTQTHARTHQQPYSLWLSLACFANRAKWIHPERLWGLSGFISGLWG